MGKSRQDKQKRESKSKVVEMPLQDGGNEAQAEEQAEGENPASKDGGGKRKKGARKKLRSAVKVAMKGKSKALASKLVEKAKEGDTECAEMVLSMIEKKEKKDGEDDDWDGPSIAEMFEAEEEQEEEQFAVRSS
jgi:hypothetical protein